MAAAKEMCVRNVSEEPRRDYKQTRKHMRWIRDKSQTGDASMATPLWLTDQSSRWHENLLVSRWRLRDVAQQAEGQPPANAEVVGLVRGSIFSRASDIISARQRSPLARQITHLRISAKRNGKRKKGESLSSLSLSFWWFHPVLARVVSRNSFKSCLCICSRESSGFPFLSDDYRRLTPRWFGNFLESLRCVQVQRYAPSKGDSRLLLQPALKKVGERSEEMMLSHYFKYLILYY